MKFDVNKYFDKYGFLGNYYEPGDMDENNHPVGQDGWVDLGDSPQRNSMFYSGLHFSEQLGIETGLHTDIKYSSLMNASKRSLGRFARGWDITFWYGDANRGSRDQEVARLIGMGCTNDRASFVRWVLGHALRLFLFTYNTRENGATKANDGSPVGDSKRSYKWKLPDFTGLSFWATEVRVAYQLMPRFLQMLVKVPLLALLLVLDVEFLIASLLEYYKPAKDNVVENHILRLVHNNLVLKTPTIALANRFQNKENLLTRLHNYFNRDNHPWFLFDLYKPLVERLIK